MEMLAPDQVVRGDIRVALCETNPALRTGFQTALTKHGVRDIEICKDTAGLLTLLDREIVDLVVCATDLPGVEFGRLVQQIRQQTIGRNPFTLVLATVNDATVEQIRALVNAGVDRVARKPLSIADMVAYVNAMTRQRRPFVATSEYFGPSRRAAARQDEVPQEVLEVPNTFRTKLNKPVSGSELSRQIDEGMSELRQLRMQNGCYVIWRLVHRLEHHFKGGAAGEVAHTDLARLAALCRDVEEQYAASGDAHVAEIAASLGLLVGRLPGGSRESAARTVDLMRKLSDVFRKAGTIDTGEAMILREIARNVRSFAEKH